MDATPGPDDARPIPQRGEGVRTAPRSDDPDDVYVVDVRGRKRDRAAAGTGGVAAGAAGGGAATGSGSTREGTRRTAPSPLPRRPRRWCCCSSPGWRSWPSPRWHAWNTVTKVDTTPGGTRPAESKGYNYLLVGSDSREGLTAAQKKEYATGNAAGRRTDSIILVHVPQSGGKPR